MKKILFAIFCIFLSLIAVNYYLEKQEEERTKREKWKKQYLPTDEELYAAKQNETLSPVQYLELKSELKIHDNRPNIFGIGRTNKLIVGSIKNKAIATSFKNFIIDLKYYSKKKEIGQDRFVISGICKPDLEIKFSHFVSVSVTSYDIQITDALPVE